MAFCSRATFSFSDVTLCTSNGSQFQVHALILANRSDVFRAMFEVDMKEKRTRKVIIEDVGRESLQIFLNFLYTAEATREEMQPHYTELVKLSHLYQVDLFRMKLDTFIAKNVLSKETIVEVLKMGYLYELETTKDAARKMIADDPDIELFDTCLKELEGHPWMTHDLSMFVVKRLKAQK